MLGFSCCQLLLLEEVAEAGDSSGTERKGNVRRWKPLPSNGSEDVTLDISVCNSGLYSVVTRCIKSPVNPVINPKPVCSTKSPENMLYLFDWAITVLTQVTA
jgi:hypothetical protein